MQHYSYLNILFSICPQEERKKQNVLASRQKRLPTLELNNLRDPEDGCYWNDDKQADGSINKKANGLTMLVNDLMSPFVQDNEVNRPIWIVPLLLLMVHILFCTSA